MSRVSKGVALVSLVSKGVASVSLVSKGVVCVAAVEAVGGARWRCVYEFSARTADELSLQPGDLVRHYSLSDCDR